MYIFLNQNMIVAPVHSSDIGNDDVCLQAIIYDA